MVSGIVGNKRWRHAADKVVAAWDSALEQESKGALKVGEVWQHVQENLLLSNPRGGPSSNELRRADRGA